MPALIQKLGELSNTPFMWASYRVGGAVGADDRILVPQGYGEGYGKLDLVKVKQFFAGSLLTLGSLREIRLRNQVMGEPMRESDVQDAFDTYCNQLNAKAVVYHYNAQQSPFDDDYTGNSNCMGRAKGFLQLMAILGVPKEQLALLQIGGAAGDDEQKICLKADADIVQANIRVVPGGPPVPAPAPNSVRIEIRNNVLTVSRTPREPFANHYATRIGVPGLGMAYWDPLERYSSRNGFPDVFTTYEPTPELMAGYRDLQRRGMVCLANPDDLQERIYLLPKASQRPVPAPPQAYFKQAAFTAVELALSQMATAEPQVAMLIDKSDYDGHAPAQPRVFKQMFS